MHFLRNMKDESKKRGKRTAPSNLSSYLEVVTGNYDACKLMITMTSRNEMVVEEKTTK